MNDLHQAARNETKSRPQNLVTLEKIGQALLEGLDVEWAADAISDDARGFAALAVIPHALLKKRCRH